MKKITFLLLSIFMLSCIGVCFAKNAKRKLNKPVFVASNKDSCLYDIKATDNYDSIFSYSVDGKFNEWGNITLELHSTLPDDSIIDKIAFGSLYIDEKYVFHRKGYEDSDTLYGRRINLRNYGLDTQIMLNNEGSALKIFGKKYGKSVSILTPAKKVLAEKEISEGVTELKLPQTPEYVYVDIKCEAQDNMEKHFVFKYPMR